MEENTVRLTIFLSAFGVLALAEILAPRRDLRLARSGRWFTNWGMSIANSITAAVLRIVLGAAAVLAALDAHSIGTGLFNQLGWVWWLEGLITFIILDFAIWLQHLASHKIPFLWRIHRVHHADRDMDVTTAIRFHPIEIALSMGFKIVLVYLLGAAVWIVIAFEIVLNASAMFNHANFRLPDRLDKMLRLLVVTPDMHRVHHSVHRAEHDANYGFNLAIWDRIFRTYVPQPAAGHVNMTIGLNDHQTGEPAKLFWSLLLAFKR